MGRLGCLAVSTMVLSAVIDLCWAIAATAAPFLFAMDVIKLVPSPPKQSAVGVGAYWYFSELICLEGETLCRLFGPPGWPRSLLRPLKYACPYGSNDVSSMESGLALLCRESKMQVYTKIICAVILGLDTVALYAAAYEGFVAILSKNLSRKVKMWHWYTRTGIVVAGILLIIVFGQMALANSQARALHQVLENKDFIVVPGVSSILFLVLSGYMLSFRILLSSTMISHLRTLRNANLYIRRVCQTAGRKRRRQFTGPILRSARISSTISRRRVGQIGSNIHPSSLSRMLSEYGLRPSSSAERWPDVTDLDNDLAILKQSQAELPPTTQASGD